VGVKEGILSNSVKTGPDLKAVERKGGGKWRHNSTEGMFSRKKTTFNDARHQTVSTLQATEGRKRPRDLN